MLKSINVGFAYYQVGEFDNAQIYSQQAASAYTTVDDKTGTVHAQQNLGLVEVARGDWPRARTLQTDSLRTAEGLQKALQLIPELREEFWQNVRVLGGGMETNQELEKAGRLVDFFELGELMCLDALQRNESCGGHFREEYQTEDGEARRNDEDYAYVAAWQYAGENNTSILHKEPLEFEYVKLATSCALTRIE